MPVTAIATWASEWASAPVAMARSHWLTDGTELGYQSRINTQQFGFGGVGIGDKTALKPLARSGQVGTGGCHHAAGAAFSGDQHPAIFSSTNQPLAQLGIALIAINISEVMLCGPPAGDHQQGAKGSHQIVEHDAPASFVPGVAVLRGLDGMKQLVRPRHRPGLDRIKKPEQGKRQQLPPRTRSG
jgi:hypothetical protein